MGGRDKAALPAPDGRGTLLSRLLWVADGAGCSERVLVGARHSSHDRSPDCGGGESVPDPAGLDTLLDRPPGIGPIGGLCALLEAAGPRPALALACDLPFLQPQLLTRLAREQPGATVLCPRDPQSGKWEPLFARYDSARVLPILRGCIPAGVRSLQTLLRELPVTELVLEPGERAQLRDWDRPEDLIAKLATDTNP